MWFEPDPHFHWMVSEPESPYLLVALAFVQALVVFVFAGIVAVHSDLETVVAAADAELAIAALQYFHPDWQLFVVKSD